MKQYTTIAGDGDGRAMARRGGRSPIIPDSLEEDRMTTTTTREYPGIRCDLCGAFPPDDEEEMFDTWTPGVFLMHVRSERADDTEYVVCDGHQVEWSEREGVNYVIVED